MFHKAGNSRGDLLITMPQPVDHYLLCHDKCARFTLATKSPGEPFPCSAQAAVSEHRHYKKVKCRTDVKYKIQHDQSEGIQDRYASK